MVLDQTAKERIQLIPCNLAHFTVNVDNHVIPGRYVNLGVPTGRDIGMRALKNEQGFAPAKGLFLSVRAREVTVDGPAVPGFDHFHRSMGGNGFFAIKGNQRGKIVALEKSQDLLTVFFTVLFRYIHDGTL